MSLPSLRVAVLALCIAGSAHAGALDVPNLDKALNYRPKLPLQVLTADGVEIAAFGAERRQFVPIERIPKRMQDAVIAVEDGNFENRGELLLVHRHDGVDLKLDYARDTLRNVQTLWRRPVNLVSKVEGRGTLFHHDGKEHTSKRHEL